MYVKLRAIPVIPVLNVSDRGGCHGGKRVGGSKNNTLVQRKTEDRRDGYNCEAFLFSIVRVVFNLIETNRNISVSHHQTRITDFR